MEENILMLSSTELISEIENFTNAFERLDLSAIQFSYKKFVEKIEEQISFLKSYSLNDVSYKKAKNVELYTIVLLSTLKSLVTAKNSIIVLRGLNPSLFSFLFYNIPIEKKWFAIYYPECFYFVLSLMKIFAETHNQFVAHSDLFVGDVSKSSFLAEAPAAKFFARIITIITLLLNQNIELLSYKSIILLIQWLNDICKVVREITTAIENCPEIINLQKTLLFLYIDRRFADDYECSKILITIIRHFQAFNSIHHEEIGNDLALRLFNVAENLEDKEFGQICHFIAPSYFSSLFLNKSINQTLLTEQFVLGKAIFSNYQFEIMINFLSDKVAPNFLLNDGNDDTWIPDTVERFCADLNLKKSKVGNKKCIDLNFTQCKKWRFIANHFALYCVENKLKTLLGKAMQTFMKFEDVVKELVTEIGDSKQLLPIDKMKKFQLFGDKSVSRRLMLCRVYFFLDIIDSMDKLMIYAIFGSMFNFAEISWSSRQFFQTNKISCQNWMIRIALPLMSICFHTGRYSQIVRLVSNVFADVERKIETELNEKNVKLDSTIQLIICWLVRALVELRAPQAIIGVQRWVKKTFGVQLNWITYAKDMAIGSLEIALKGFSETLKKEKLNDHVLKALQDMMLKIINSLRYNKFNKQFYETIFDEKNIENQTEMTEAAFKQFQIKKIETLSSWPLINEFEKGSTYFDKKESVIAWSLKSYIEQLELPTIQFCSKMSLQSKSEARIEIQILEEELYKITQYLLINETDENSMLSNKIGAIKAILYLMKEQHKFYWNKLNVINDNRNIYKNSKEFNYYASSIIDLCKVGNVVNRMEVGQMLCVWLNRLQNIQNNMNNEFENKINYILINVYGEMAYLAAKTKNAALCQLHINNYLENVTNTNKFNIFFNNETNNRNDEIFENNFNQFFNNSYLLSIFSSCNNAINNVENDTFKFKETSINLKTFLRILKNTWEMNSDNIEIDQQKIETRTNCFKNLLNVLCTFFTSDTSKDTKRINLLGKICIHLGRYSEKLNCATNIVFHKHNLNPHMLLQQVLNSREYLETNCMDMEPKAALEGAFYMLAESIAIKNLKIYKALAQWANNQMFTKTIINSNEKDYLDSILQISANECTVFKRMGVNLLPQAENYEILNLFGKCAFLEEFKLAVDNLEMCNEKKTNLINAINMREFSQLWLIIKRRQYKLFEISVTAHIHLLENFSDFSSPKKKFLAISTCLNLLKFLNLFPQWFNNVVELNWIVRINGDVWKDVIPQLFAYLNNENNFVRQIIMRILEKIGQISPHAICYQAILNIDCSPKNSSSKTTLDDNQTEEICDKNTNINVDNISESINESFECKDAYQEKIVENLSRFKKQTKRNKNFMQRSCNLLLKKLHLIYPDLIDSIINFCNEIKKINALFEDKWLCVLTKLDSVILKKNNVSKDESIEFVASDLSKDDEKFDTIEIKNQKLADLIYNTISTLYECTCLKTNDKLTDNEKQFYSVYKNTIEEALFYFDKNRLNLWEAWQPFRIIIKTLSTRAMRRSSLYLNTEEISLYLSTLSSSVIPVPGQEFKSYTLLNEKMSSKIVTISKVHKMMYVLPTKTRPKKITFVGSNGKDYSFLLKGQDDLRLDERIMQLLRIYNFMLGPTEINQNYLSSVYSVTPMGYRFGLIEWVEGATPLFQIYKKSKIHELEELSNKKNQENTKNVINNATKIAETKQDNCDHENTKDFKKLEPDRPSDLFYTKLKSIFAKEKISDDILRDRSRWPISCLKKVYVELTQSTPCDILSKELWMRAGTSFSWWQAIKRFSRSTAVMSAIGSIIGLGDRHLDNVLVNLSTGQIVHVDYNVCFEKGRFLRVPETVPFRLTRNIVQALGPTKIEGIFRESCISVMETLQRNAEVLLTLLKIFVHDPLFDCVKKTIKDELLKNGYLFFSKPRSENLKLKDFESNKDEVVEILQAKNVIYRIYRKLNGYELLTEQKLNQDDCNLETIKMSPSQQIDFLIEKATNTTNLSLLFEGWTAWV